MKHMVSTHYRLGPGRLRRHRRVQTAVTLGLVFLGPLLAVSTFLAMGPFSQDAGSPTLRLILLADLIYVLVIAALVLARVIRLVADRHHAALTVSDSGPGLSPQQRARLFQPFAAGDPRSGSGLGLAICREIVQTLGGQIELENRLEPGSAGVVAGLDATVRLPLDASPHQAERQLRG